MSISTLDKVVSKVRLMALRRVRCFALANPLIQDKIGLEIGGPSAVFSRKWMPLYRSVRQLDNCNFSEENVWAKQASKIMRPPGNDFVADGSNLASVPDSAYDFVLSSHNLEHFANPIKAIKEWQRVTRPGGTLILAVPNYRYTFDHRRNPTRVEHMLLDYEQDTPESDLSHLDEILDRHDLSRDPWAGS
ncbi:MAG: class I SAM-dependent methyltransferase [Terracidiphilus sp.]